MKKRKRSKGQILTATALKVTPLLLVAVLGTKFAYDTVMDDYKGILGLNDLKNEVDKAIYDENTKSLRDYSKSWITLERTNTNSYIDIELSYLQIYCKIFINQSPKQR